MPERNYHQQAVRTFMNQEFSPADWAFRLPHGWGHETYYAHGNGQTYFIKLGVPLATYTVMASLGLTPPILRSGMLQDGTNLLVQPYVDGRKPSWSDFHLHLEEIARIVNLMHHHTAIRQVLAEVPLDQYRSLGMTALTHLRQRWNGYKRYVPTVADEVDDHLDDLALQIEALDGAGTVASHNDICNANWIIATDGKIYLIDLDAMSLDDPAHDLGALLWWYYPPEVRSRFAELAGYEFDERLRHRMRLRMALHFLHILLPRENSFDQFDANHFISSLDDFRAVLAGEENPRGYDDD